MTPARKKAEEEAREILISKNGCKPQAEDCNVRCGNYGSCEVLQEAIADALEARDRKIEELAQELANEKKYSAEINKDREELEKKISELKGALGNLKFSSEIICDCYEKTREFLSHWESLKNCIEIAKAALEKLEI